MPNLMTRALLPRRRRFASNPAATRVSEFPFAPIRTRGANGDDGYGYSENQAPSTPGYRHQGHRLTCRVKSPQLEPEVILAFDGRYRARTCDLMRVEHPGDTRQTIPKS
jgi:hypothetical protein